MVVPIYDAYDDLKRCLAALVRNTNSPARLLLINDCSPDPRISRLLDRYRDFDNVEIIDNGENLGFVETVNRGLAESKNDVVILNTDTEVAPRWLENLTLAAYMNPRTATATAVSNNAGAFSVPEVSKDNGVPSKLTKDETGRLIMQQSMKVYPDTPTGNGFCMFIKRAALDEIGYLDAENFPVGYAEENDFSMRARQLGWNHVVDDATFVFHRRSASFGERQKELLKSSRRVLDRLHPEYTQLARTFVASEAMKCVRENAKNAYAKFEAGWVSAKPKVLFVIHQAQGGTPYTNQDLMRALAKRYSPYLLLSTGSHLRLFRLGSTGLVLVEEHSLKGEIKATEFSRPDYREIIFDMLGRHRFEMVHIRHLLGHTFDLPEIASRLRVPVILSFHDFYFSCPTIHLIDDNEEYCGGVCTPGFGQCTIMHGKLKAELPVLKHAWLSVWRRNVEKMFRYVDVFVTTSESAKETYVRSYPGLCNRTFDVIEHGRDLLQDHLASRPDGGPIKILVPGNINVHKGARFLRELKNLDVEGHLELHFLGKVAGGFEDLGIMHGAYERDEFNIRVSEIRPSFIGIFSIWPETYCHTLTEAWAVGVPVLASDIGVLRERVSEHGGGWLLDYRDPGKAYRRILEIAGDREAYRRELRRSDLHGIRDTDRMAHDYMKLYESVLHGRRAFVEGSGTCVEVPRT